jgi:ABC transporter substrate binding protein
MSVARTKLAAIVALVTPALPHVASTQQAAKARRLGYLTPGGGSGVFAQKLRLDPLREGLREQGWSEGENFVIEYRFAQAQPELLDRYAADLAAAGVDVIVTAGAAAAMAARRATATIPIVMVDPGDPVQLGLVSSLAHPGGNVTGVTSITSALAGKRLELLKELNSKIARVGMLWNAAIPPAEIALSDVREGGAKLGIELQTVEVRGPQGFAEAFATLMARRVDALLVFPDPLTFPTARSSSTSRRRTAWRRCTALASSWTRTDSSRTVRITPRCSDAPANMLDGSSRAPGQARCPSSSRRHSSW